MASIRDALARVKEDPSALIDPDAVRDACRAAQHRWRDRTLDPVATLRAFVLQVACGNTAMAHLVRLLGGTFTESAYCQARQRLGVEVFRAVLGAFTASLRGRSDDQPGLWRGHRVYLVDGTGSDMPETPALRDHFGLAPSQEPGCGFPVAKSVALLDAACGYLLDMTINPGRTAELPQAARLHSCLREGDILVGDRAFCAYVHLALLMARGLHGVFRVSASRKLEFPAPAGPPPFHSYNRHTIRDARLVRAISDGDQIVEVRKPHNRPAWLTPEEFAKIPGRLTVRAVRYRIEHPGFRGREVTLLTTLLDDRKYPKEAVAELYGLRWRAETDFRALKRTLGMTSLRCTTVAGVTKELLVYALVYNAVRALMERDAARRGLPPDRVSFIDAVRCLVLLLVPGPASDPPPLKTNPLRPGRIHPRCRKRRNRSFPFLTTPRAAMIDTLKQETPN